MCTAEGEKKRIKGLKKKNVSMRWVGFEPETFNVTVDIKNTSTYWRYRKKNSGSKS